MKLQTKALLAAALALGGVASTSQAAMFYFSTSNSDPGAVSPTNTASTNPTITLNPGSSTTLYIWAQLNDLEAINGFGLDVKQSNSAVGVTATGSSVDNPSNVAGRSTYNRWAGASNGSLNSAPGTLLSNMLGAFVSGNYYGLDGYFGVPGGDTSKGINGTYAAQAPNADGSGEAAVGSLLVGSLTIQAPANSPGGTTLLSLATGAATTSFEPGLGGPTVHYGAGDVAVDPRLAATTSQLADATIIVPVPEPASIGLLGLGAMGLVARRRRA